MVAAGLGDPRVRSWAIVTGAVMTLAVAAVAATASSIEPVVDTGGGWFVRPLRRQERRRTEVTPGGRPGEQSEPVLPEVLGVLAEIALVLLAALLTILVVRFIRRQLDRLRTTRDRAMAVPADEAPPTGTPALARAVAEGLARIDEGTTDDAVIACWLRLEGAAAEAGLGRRPAETPAELTVRVLGRAAVPTAAIERLLALYRTARYSSHPLPPSARAEAEEALREIRTGLQVTWP